eukprot:2575327-Pyramimonas_sp.AAC.1
MMVVMRVMMLGTVDGRRTTPEPHRPLNHPCFPPYHSSSPHDPPIPTPPLVLSWVRSEEEEEEEEEEKKENDDER